MITRQARIHGIFPPDSAPFAGNRASILFVATARGIPRLEESAATAALEWERMLADLVPYPVDDNGLRIASNQAVDMSHRHFSHLLALYPLYQLDPVVRSVLHRHRIGGGKALPVKPSDRNAFGVKKGKELKQLQA